MKFFFQDHFDTPEILLPLLGMDKLMIIEAYLSKKEIAAAFVRFVSLFISGIRFAL